MAPHGNPSVQKLISERQLPSHLHRRTSVRFPSPISFISGNWNVRHTCWSIMTEGTNKQHAALIVLITYDDLWYSLRFLFFVSVVFLGFFTWVEQLQTLATSVWGFKFKRRNGEEVGQVEESRMSTDRESVSGRPEYSMEGWRRWKKYSKQMVEVQTRKRMNKTEKHWGVGGVEEEAVKEKNNTVLRESRNMTWQS